MLVTNTPGEEKGDREVGRLGDMSRFTGAQMSAYASTLGLTLQVIYFWGSGLSVGAFTRLHMHLLSLEPQLEFLSFAS